MCVVLCVMCFFVLLLRVCVACVFPYFLFLFSWGDMFVCCCVFMFVFLVRFVIVLFYCVCMFVCCCFLRVYPIRCVFGVFVLCCL